jgi:hypothetical protein
VVLDERGARVERRDHLVKVRLSSRARQQPHVFVFRRYAGPAMGDRSGAGVVRVVWGLCFGIGPEKRMTAADRRANGKQEPAKRWYGKSAALISLGAIGMALGAAVIRARGSTSPKAASAKAEHDAAADNAGPLIVRSLVAQVAVLLTIAGAGAYVDGVLVLCLKLEFRSFSWTWVLGQSLQDFILLTALGDVILPSLLIGCFIGPLILRKRGSRPRPGSYTRKRLALFAFRVAAASALACLPATVDLACCHATRSG